MRNEKCAIVKCRDLDDAAGFRTDTQIVTKKTMKSIITQTKKDGKKTQKQTARRYKKMYLCKFCIKNRKNCKESAHSLIPSV